MCLSKHPRCLGTLLPCVQALRQLCLKTYWYPLPFDWWAWCGLCTAFKLVFMWVDRVRTVVASWEKSESSLTQMPYVMDNWGSCFVKKMVALECFQWIYLCMNAEHWGRNYEFMRRNHVFWIDWRRITTDDLDGWTCSPKHSTAVNNFETILNNFDYFFLKYTRASVFASNTEIFLPCSH